MKYLANKKKLQQNGKGEETRKSGKRKVTIGTHPQSPTTTNTCTSSTKPKPQLEYAHMQRTRCSLAGNDDEDGDPWRTRTQVIELDANRN